MILRGALWKFAFAMVTRRRRSATIRHTSDRVLRVIEWIEALTPSDLSRFREFVRQFIINHSCGMPRTLRGHSDSAVDGEGGCQRRGFNLADGLSRNEEQRTLWTGAVDVTYLGFRLHANNVVGEIRDDSGTADDIPDLLFD